MDVTYDVLITCLPQSVNEVVIKNLFKTIGSVTKVKIIDDKRNEKCKICYVGFKTMEDAQNAVKLADKSTAFGEPMNVSVSKKSVDMFESNCANRSIDDYKSFGYDASTDGFLTKGFSTVGRGRGFQMKHDISIPSFTVKSINLSCIKITPREMIDIEIVDLSNLDCIFVRPLLITENSMIEINAILKKINLKTDNLVKVESPKIGECYLGKWDDGCFYRAELLSVLNDGNFEVTFVDEGTFGDIISDLRIIPEGPLQDHPKQFIKISLGCKDSDCLRNFILDESSGKKVSLFWLGEFHDNSPLINLFLGGEEILEKYSLLNKVNVRGTFSLKFKDIPNHKSNTDCSSITLIQSMYKSQLDFTVQIREPAVIQCTKVLPRILPTPGDVCIYEKRNGVNNLTYLRCVIKRRQLFSFDILLFDSGEHLSNVSIDSLYAADEWHIINPPFTIICELDKSLGYSEDLFLKIMYDENLKFSIMTYKGNNRYMVSASVIKNDVSKYPVVNLKKFLGQSNKVIVTHIVSPLNFFVQIDRSEYVQTLNDIHEKINISYSTNRFSGPRAISIGQAVVAPFSTDGFAGENFRATVLEVRSQSPEIHVYYIDYGNDGWVNYKDLFDVNEEIVQQPALALNCTLDVYLRKEAWNHAIELFTSLVGFTDNGFNELVMQVIGENNDRLVVDLTSLVKGSITMALVKSGTCFMNESDKSLSLKPMCNGDVKVSPRNKQLSETTVLNDTPVSSISIIPGDADDYDTLLKKINELERRLSQLEAMN